MLVSGIKSGKSPLTRSSISMTAIILPTEIAERQDNASAAVFESPGRYLTFIVARYESSCIAHFCRRGFLVLNEDNACNA